MTTFENSKLGIILKKHGFFIYNLAFLLVLSLSIIFDILVLRQILGFFFLTFVPGWLILRILKLDKSGLPTNCVLCVGLSVAFIMFSGLLINTIYPFFGNATPLTTNSLLISFSFIILILAIITDFLNKDKVFENALALRFTAKEKIYLIPPAVFPIFAIFGMRVMNNNNNNIMLMVLMFLIPAYAVFVVIIHNKVTERFYAPVIFFISFSLIILLGLRSNHIIGADIHTEYYLFQQTLNHGNWQLFSDSVLDSSLSISILPTVYQSFINMNSEYLYKILYPMLFLVSPLVVYIISRKYLNSPYSFLAALFFMSQFDFINAEQNPRTIIAILFFGLSVLTLFYDKLTDTQKRLLFIIFSASCIVSHYSTTYIFFIVLGLAWLFRQLFSRFFHLRQKFIFIATESGKKINNAVHRLTFRAIVIFFLMIFLWYSQLTGPAFKGMLDFFSSTTSSLQNFFDMESRGPSSVILGSGIESKTVPHQLNFIFSWLVILFVSIGIITLLIRYRKTIYVDIENKYRIPKYLIQNVDAEYFLLALLGTFILATALILPFVSIGYDTNRTLLQLMTLLSPFFVIGGIAVSKLFHSKFSYVVILLALIPFFLSSTGVMFQIFGVQQSISLNSGGQEYDSMYVHEQETAAAKWLNKGATNNKIYSDWYGTVRLISQGDIESPIYAESFIEKAQPIGSGYFFLRYTGVVDRKLLDNNSIWHSLDDYSNQFITKDLIYSSNGSSIYH